LCRVLGGGLFCFFFFFFFLGRGDDFLKTEERVSRDFKGLKMWPAVE